MLLRCARARRRRMHLFLMARIVFHAMAYRGDVYPYVPVASELSRRGHEVAYVVPREFHASFSAEPFRCVHSGTDFGPLALDQYGDYLARWGMRLGGAMVLRLYFGVFTVPHLPELFGAIDDELADADLLVSHPAASMVGALSCERRGIPWIVGDLFPMLLPTDAAPPMPGLPNLGPRVNRKMWQIAKSKRLDGLSCGEGFRNFRRILGLSVPDDWNVIDARLSPHRNLGFVSKHYIDAQPGWPENYELVGFTPWIGPNNGGLSDDVVEFLDAGDPRSSSPSVPLAPLLNPGCSSTSPPLSTALTPAGSSSPPTSPTPNGSEGPASGCPMASGPSFRSHRCFDVAERLSTQVHTAPTRWRS